MQMHLVDLAAMHYISPRLAGAHIQSVDMFVKDELKDVNRQLLPAQLLLHCGIFTPHSSSTVASTIVQLYLECCCGILAKD